MIFAKGGRIFRRSSSRRDRHLIDLNGLSPDPHPAPAWASIKIVAKGKDRDV
jgi:hypothetical protein